jgi:putative ATP-dependent endonuclease of the OLD family
MNINKFSIKNVKSFGEEVVINFTNELNIFIGSNGGGKSNFLDILNYTLNYFFIKPWRIKIETDENNRIKRKTFEERHQILDPIDNFLEKHTNKEGDEQILTISFYPEEEDIQNIKTILETKERLPNFEVSEFRSKYVDNFKKNFEGFDLKSLRGKELIFSISNNKHINESSLNVHERCFFVYLKFFNFFKLLVEEFNQQASVDKEKINTLFSPISYFSPYRAFQSTNLQVSLPEVNQSALGEKIIKSDSKTISSSFDLANYNFAKKLRYLDDNIGKFKRQEEIKFVKKYVEKLGYKDFSYSPVNKEKNIYEGYLVKQSGGHLDISKASSGEKEILNFLLGIFSSNIKNGVIIIDEPELHLHPRWQHVLLELFNDFVKTRGIQFLIVTHSPYFITTDSIHNVFRVYLHKENSKVVPPQALTQKEYELFMLVNIFNNTKIFFSDRVIMVEGDVDQIIYKSILDNMQSNTLKPLVIEIINTQQTGGIKKNKQFLDKWKIKSSGIVDLDKKKEVKGITNISILKNGSIEDYFQNEIKKKHFKINDAIQIAKKSKKVI